VLRGVDGADRRSLRPHRAVRREALTVETWEELFEAALRAGDVLGASDILRSAGKDGWIRKGERERAAAILERVAPAPFVRRDWGERLLPHPRRVDKELAVMILIPLAKTHPRDIERAIERLRPETDPGVRQAAERLAKALAAARATPA
jgi:hypothetical protein